MDETDWTFAFACNNQRIAIIIIITPADSALDLVWTQVWHILGACDLKSFTELLLIQLFSGKLKIVAFEIFNSKSYSTKFDSVKLLDFVIVFSLFIFERSSNKPKSIYRFFFLFFRSNSMVKIVALIIFFELAKTPSIWMLFCINYVIRLSEINLIIISNDLSLRLSLQTHLDNISWFIVEKTVWVS